MRLKTLIKTINHQSKNLITSRGIVYSGTSLNQKRIFFFSLHSKHHHLTKGKSFRKKKNFLQTIVYTGKT